MELSDYRKELNGLDDELLQLFEKRMRVVEKIGDYKLAHGLPVLDNSREQKILDRVAAKMPEDLKGYSVELYTTLMRLSRNHQSSRMEQNGTNNAAEE